MKQYFEKIEQYLPSKKFAYSGGAILLVLIGGIIYYIKTKPTQKSALDISQIEDLRKSTQDSDKDGLYDWEEDLWQTSKTTPDSDGDGTQDGEEIKQKRDPLIKGPLDKITDIQQLFVYDLPNEQETQTKSEFYRSLPEVAALINKSITENKPITKEDIARVTQNSSAFTIAVTSRYSTKDLKIVSISNEKYIEQLLLLFAKYHNSETNDVNTVIESVINEDTQSILTLKSSAARYENFAKDLIQLPVNRAYAQNIVSIANSLYGQSGALVDMSYAIVDPLRGLRGITLYEEFQSLISEELTKIVNK